MLKLVKQFLNEESGDALQWVLIAAVCCVLVYGVYTLARGPIENFSGEYEEYLDF